MHIDPTLVLKALEKSRTMRIAMASMELSISTLEIVLAQLLSDVRSASQSSATDGESTSAPMVWRDITPDTQKDTTDATPDAGRVVGPRIFIRGNTRERGKVHFFAHEVADLYGLFDYIKQNTLHKEHMITITHISYVLKP